MQNSNIGFKTWGGERIHLAPYEKFWGGGPSPPLSPPGSTLMIVPILVYNCA